MMFSIKIVSKFFAPMRVKLRGRKKERDDGDENKISHNSVYSGLKLDSIALRPLIKKGAAGVKKVLRFDGQSQRRRSRMKIKKPDWGFQSG